MENINVERLYPTPYANSTLLPLLLLSLASDKQHTPTTINYMRTEYDYIVVGAGAAGSVMAGRLSEHCANVLLLEAGKSPPLLTEIPGIARSFIGTDIDWNYFTVPQKHTGAALRNRQLQWPSGKAIGGSTILNGMLFIRGNRENYDRWARAGATGWSYEEVLPYFKKLEDYRAVEPADPGYHGFYGPMTAERPAYFPEFRRAVQEAASKLGYPSLDSNGRFQRGLHEFPMATRGSQRCSVAKAYLVPAENRHNLDIVANAFVTKVVIREGRAVGVNVVFQGQTYFVKAKKEVILSAGTVNSAQLLMLSGIGPRERLEQLQIPVIADLPVGLNFQDHQAAIVPYTMTDQVPPFLTKLAHPFNIHRYLNTRRGPLTSAEGISNIAFLTNLRDVPRSAVPDQALYFLEGVPAVARDQTNILPEAYQAIFGPFENRTTAWCAATIMNPRSRGSITLNSSDPFDPPLIDPNYFDDPRDITDVVEGMKHCQEIMMHESLRHLNIRPFTNPVPGCETLMSDMDRYFACIIRGFVITTSHQVGTARMGDPRNPSTVVDPELRVLGIRRLRVVDASVMPIIPSANTMIPTIMVAEKAAEMIKDTMTCYNY